MGDYSINKETLTDLADAVRGVVSSEAYMTPAEMTEALNNYEPPSGGPAEEKQINFIDYDGSIVASYTAEEWASVTSLPDNPTHEGLVAQGWNWTKAQLDAELAVIPEDNIYVGQMYTTFSGGTEMDIVLESACRTPTFQCSVNGSISIDWGDGSARTTVTGTSLTSRKTSSHAYEEAGKYTITIYVNSGTFNFYGRYTSSSTVYLPPLNANGTSSSSSTNNVVFGNSIKAVRIGDNAGLGERAFHNCASIRYITIPRTATFGTFAFYYCQGIAQITIPTGTTTIPNSVVNQCYGMKYVCLPSGILSIENGAFGECRGLRGIHLPNGITSCGTSSLPSNNTLDKLVVPGSLGTISGNMGFSAPVVILKNGITSIEDSVFQSHFIARIDLPESITNIGSSAFTGKGFGEYHIRATDVPTLGSSAFAVATGVKIFVPEESVDAYKAATNWSSYASYIYGE